MSTSERVRVRLEGAGYTVRTDTSDAGVLRIYEPRGDRALLVGMVVIRNDRVTYAELPRSESHATVFPFHRLTAYDPELSNLYQHIKDHPAHG